MKSAQGEIGIEEKHMTGFKSKRAAAQDKVTDIDGHVVRDVRKPKKALPHAALLAELMNPNNPKNEREHAAVREIERLQKALAQLAQAEQCNYPDCKCSTENPCLKGLAQPAQEPSYWLGYGLQAHTDKPFDGATPLYTTPPQPAQEPVAWQTMEAKYSTLEKLDIRMGDGSILCDVWPQSDGDFWWEGSGTGEKFIDPKYANVTHWRVHSDTTAPQRPLVDLTDDDWKEIEDMPDAFDQGVAWCLARLKEKNNG